MFSLEKVKRGDDVSDNVRCQESNRDCEEFRQDEEMLELGMIEEP